MTIKSIDIEELTNAVDRVAKQIGVTNDLLVMVMNKLNRMGILDE